MDSVIEDLGIPKKYLRATIKENRVVALVHRSWLKHLLKNSQLTTFKDTIKFDDWPSSNEFTGDSWVKIFIHTFKKRDVKVIPLPRIRQNPQEEHPLLFSQLMQYIHQTNYKNLWKEAYKKYNTSADSAKDMQIVLGDYNDILREIIIRTYGCPIVNLTDESLGTNLSKEFEAHENVLPTLCTVETHSHFFLLQAPFIEHSLNECVSFSPAILNKCSTKPLFVVYQFLQVMKALHDRSLTLGEITLDDIYLNEDLWIFIFPQLSSNIYFQDLPRMDILKNSLSLPDCRIVGHKFDRLKCQYCGMRTYDRVQVTGEEPLDKLFELWSSGQISNFTYLTALNNLAGRKFGDPNCHHVFPWVTDFSSRNGKNWRDLRKSKYRLNKGDRQLDLTFDNSQTQIPHHVSDVLSSITYYVYMSRRTPKSVLCKNVRTIWVPAEYPSSIQRMQEWTPDECIPEFFSDPTVFKTIHDDLDDLDVPVWSSSPEDFIEQHREALESAHVSERLHHWIDLTFGYKLSGNAAIKAKNVCLHLVDGHCNLTSSGVVQLFTHPHPPKSSQSQFWGKSPPKIFVQKDAKLRIRDRSNSSVHTIDSCRSEDDLTVEDPPAARSPLGLPQFLSRSRQSLNEEPKEQIARSPSNQRSISLGPKNPTFTSHVSSKTRQLSVPLASLASGIIYLPKEYNPGQALQILENKHNFYTKTFKKEPGPPVCKESEAEALPDFHAKETLQYDDQSKNSFTNRFFSENFEGRIHHTKAIKSYTFPIDNQFGFPCRGRPRQVQKQENQVICNYVDIIASRRIKELQILGCLIVEIFMMKQLRAMGSMNGNFLERLKTCQLLIKNCSEEVPPCIRYITKLLLLPHDAKLDEKLESTKLDELKLFLQGITSEELKEQGIVSHDESKLFTLANKLEDLKFMPKFKHVKQNRADEFRYPAVTDLGLPPPSAHLLLEPLLNFLIPFPKHFFYVYKILKNLKEFSSASYELDLIYHFDCNGEMCSEYETLEKTKILFVQNIAECKVKLCAQQLERFLRTANVDTNGETIGLLIPHIKELIENPPTSVLACWYLFDPIARTLGSKRTADIFLNSILKLYEAEPVTYSKIAKLYHHSFLLRLLVRLGLKLFLEHFITPLVEAVGGYRDYEKTDYILHTHCAKTIRKTSNLRSMESEQPELSPSDESSSSGRNQSEAGFDSNSSSKQTATCKEASRPDDKDLQDSKETEMEPEMFEFETDDSETQNVPLQSLIEHLELNVSTDLPFNHSCAEEALDAALLDTEEQLRLEGLNSSEEEESNVGMMSPTIPIPSSFHKEVVNISCDVGSRTSDDYFFSGNDLSRSGNDLSRSGNDLPRSGNECSRSSGAIEKDTLHSSMKGPMKNIATIPRGDSKVNSTPKSDDYNVPAHSFSNHFESNQYLSDHRKSLDLPSTSFESTTSNSAPPSSRREVKISDMSSDSLIWLSHRLGPVLTARYLSRNLLKMLTLCYVGKENLVLVAADTAMESSGDNLELSIAASRVVGDKNAAKVLECLTSIAALYGEQIILLQFLPHMSELISLCKRKLTANLEGGLISCLALLKHIVPYLSDVTLMDQLQDVILKNIIHPSIRLLGSTKYCFPNGSIARNILARKYLDALYILSLRIGADLTRTHLAVPALQRFFLIFEKISNEGYHKVNDPQNETLAQSTEEKSNFVEICRDGTTTEWSIGGHPIQISHIRLRDSESADSLSPTPPQISPNTMENTTSIQALDEIRLVFTPDLAHTAYVPFLKHVGQVTLETGLKNHQAILTLCQKYESEINAPLTSNLLPESKSLLKSERNAPSMSNSFGSNIALIGNRIDVQSEPPDVKTPDVLSLISNRMDNSTRHLRGNWLAYWEHEIGRSEKDTMFNFKQIKLQVYTGHTHSVKSLYVLDNENSFMSSSRDKTVKLWSLRSQGDGSSTSTCQSTYNLHKKSVLSITFLESLRLCASCDSVVHIWDPFMGEVIKQMESPKYAPVNILKSRSAPSCLIYAATTEGTIKVIDARMCAYVHELKVALNPTCLIRSLAISPCGNWVVAGLQSGYITVLDTRTGLVLASWKAHEAEVLQVIAAGGDLVISSSFDQTIGVWNVHDGKFKHNMKGSAEPVHCLNTYNNELISGTTGNRIGVHTSLEADASFSSTKLRSDAFRGLLTSMAVLPLNRLLLLGADNGNISLLC